MRQMRLRGGGGGADPAGRFSAFDGDLELLLSTVAKQFGLGAAGPLFPPDKLVVLNRLPALDRADEVVVGGQVVGLLRFDPRRLALEFSPKLEGARRIALAGAISLVGGRARIGGACAGCLDCCAAPRCPSREFKFPAQNSVPRTREFCFWAHSARAMSQV
ncbi:MAG: hypothetical protein QMC89_05355 [Candidatus Hodarchaeaceae archaeon]|nr:hypothetical protein [Candidatus Hodarchaeaceae archaeon]